ncbi:Crp/Fnr family transcriptional regulator [Parvularcula oceani]|uniref:Crp/Fnr family transcriptional regulator n=1 Tax=Parvularcula oceani TaxID=1247963 RepID=UPI0009E08ECB|nr:Crp/Fnr family transcriptional regulator [Parvularcula oceani]
MVFLWTDRAGEEMDGRHCAEENVAEALRAWQPVGDLPPALVSELAGICDVQRHLAGETVFTMGQHDGSVLYVLLDGDARLTRANGECGDVAVEDLHGGDMIGLTAFVLEDDAMAAAALHAVSAITLLSFDAAEMRRLCREAPEMAWALMRVLARTGRRATSPDPRMRVYRHLLTLVRRDRNGAAIPEMPRHAVLAEAAGVTEVEAAGAVADLIAQSVVRRAYPGLDVLDAEALNRAAYG